MTVDPSVRMPFSARRRLRLQRGSESVELALLLPVIVLVLAALVIAARLALAGDRMTGVAGIAARDASLARTPTAAQQSATTAAETALAAADLHCTGVTVAVDTSGFATPPGVPARVTVDVACTVSLSDVAVPGLPGSRTLRDSASSPLDPARGTP